MGIMLSDTAAVGQVHGVSFAAQNHVAYQKLLSEMSHKSDWCGRKEDGPLSEQQRTFWAGTEIGRS
jgi:hypothetical protein